MCRRWAFSGLFIALLALLISWSQGGLAIGFIESIPDRLSVWQIAADNPDSPTKPRSLPWLLLLLGNSAPVANAGSDQVVPLGAVVSLDGNGSRDSDGDPLNFLWALSSKPTGSAAQLSSTTNPKTSFVADALGSFVATLTVNDGLLDSDPDTVTVSVVNRLPIADGGPDQEVTVNDIVQLDGSASNDPDGSGLSFAWTLTLRPADSTAALSSPAIANPTFVADKEGQYEARLIVNDGIEDSLPDLVSINASPSLNRPPLADAGTAQTVTAGQAAQLDGTASSDPDGDPLSFAWTLITRPTGSTAVLTGETTATPELVPDVAGVYVAELVVSESVLSSDPSQVAITAQPVIGPNAPPELQFIGNQIVELGDTLVLQLEASDLDSDPLAFSASPVPLPEGASLNGGSGLFSFKPNEAQLGSFDLTFSVSDGVAADSETITVTVQAPPAGNVTSVAGRLLDANAAAVGQDIPVVGAVVSLLGTNLSAVSGNDGSFLIDGLPVITNPVIDIDTGPAQLAPDGSKYGAFREVFELIPNADNVIARPIYLPRLDPAGIAMIVAGQDTLVVNPNLGVSMMIPADTAMMNGQPFEGEISISAVPADQAPVALPDTLGPALLITIQPVGLEFTQPLALTFPNLDGAAAGNELDLYSVDPDTGQFAVVGTGLVSADGTVVETIAGGVRQASWHAFLQAILSLFGSDTDNSSICNCVNIDTGSRTALHSGNLREAHSFAAYRSFGATRQLQLVYNSRAADPAPVIRVTTTILSRSAIPPAVSSAVIIGGVSQGSMVFTTTSQASDPADPGLSDSVNEDITQAVQFDASALPTGSQPYQLRLVSVFPATSITSVINASVLVNNQSASPFGAGWTMNGLQRLWPQADGSKVVTEGDGSILRFAAIPPELSTSGSMLAVEPPASVTLSSTESNQNIIVFIERRNHRLTQDLVVTNVASGIFPGQINSKPDTFPAGLIISSYFVHFDQVGSSQLRLTGSVTLPNEIIGVITRNAQLDNSDGELGIPSTTYATGTGRRGIEVGSQDQYSISDDLRTVTVNLRVGGAIDQMRIITLGDNEPLRTDTFDMDAQGWTVSAGATGPTFASFGGNPDGNLTATDLQFNDAIGGFPPAVWFWQASPALLADLNGLRDGALVYDLKEVPASLSGAINDVVLEGNGQAMTRRVLYIPGVEWKRFVVALRPVVFASGRWVFKNTSQSPTEQEFNAILDNATLLGIRGEHTTGADTGAIDNVTITKISSVPLQTSGAFRAPAGDFSTLTPNGDGTFTRTLKDGTRIEFNANGLQTALVDLNGPTTSYGYDGGGRLTSIIDPATLLTTLTYAGGLLSSVTDPAIRTTLFEHDAAGNLTRITDPDGSIRRFSYDAHHRLASQTSKRGFITTYEYDAFGRHIRSNWPDGTIRRIAPSESIALADVGAGEGTEGSPLPYTRPVAVKGSFFDGNGNPVTYELNRFGSPITVTDALDRVTTFERDADNNPTRTVQPNGMVTDIVYDDRGNPLTVTQAVGDPLERLFSFTYDAVTSKPRTITDPATNTTTIDYDGQGNPVEIIDAAGTMRMLAYADASCPGEVTSITRAVGLPEANTTTFQYDPATCNLTQLTDAEGNVTTFAYDMAGNVTSVTEGVGTPEQRTSTFTYDALNRLLTATDGESNTTIFRYDPAGNLSEVESPTGETQFRDYDQLGRLAAIDDPVTGLATFAYDAQGNLKTTLDAVGAETEFFYDVVNRVERSLDAELGERFFTYDASDNVKTVIDARSNTTTFDYDLLDRVIKRTNPLTEFREFFYDSRGNLERLVDAKGQESLFVYDVLSRLETITTPDNLIALTYDPLSNVKTVTDEDSALDFTYDGLDRVLTAGTVAPGVQPAVTLTNQYDPVGNRFGLADTLGGLTQFALDFAGRMTGVTTPSSQAISLNYDPASRFTQIAFPNDVASDFTYDLRGRLETISYTGNAGASLLEQFTFQYNNVGSITEIAELAQTRNFGYDLLQQVISGGTAAAPESYDYDAEGNRTTSHLSAFHDTDINNRLLEDDDFTYVYDANGNLETKTNKTSLDVTTYSYDAEDQLTRIDFPGGGFAAYRYDGLRRRIEKDVDGLITRYVYDGEDIVLEFDGTDTVLARYTHGPGRDQPLSVERGGADYFYQADHLGSVRQLTDAAGFVANSYEYDSFGRLESVFETIPQPYTFTGREHDSESGLYYYRARHYDPVAGRFIQEDPIGFGADGYSLHRYILNSPTNLTDPSGRNVLACVVVAAAVYIGIAAFVLDQTSDSSDEGQGRTEGELASVPNPELDMSSDTSDTSPQNPDAEPRICSGIEQMSNDIIDLSNNTPQHPIWNIIDDNLVTPAAFPKAECVRKGG